MNPISSPPKKPIKAAALVKMAGVGALIAAATAGCAAAWEQRDDACVREIDSGHEQRVINYTDPELCERQVKERPPDHLRVPPPED